MKVFNTLIRTTALVTVLLASAPKTYAMDKPEDDQLPSEGATQLLHTLDDIDVTPPSRPVDQQVSTPPTPPIFVSVHDIEFGVDQLVLTPNMFIISSLKPDFLGTLAPKSNFPGCLFPGRLESRSHGSDVDRSAFFSDFLFAGSDTHLGQRSFTDKPSLQEYVKTPDSDYGTQVQRTLFVDSEVFFPDEIWTQLLSQTLDLQIAAPDDKAIAQCLSRLRGVCRGFYTMVYGALRAYKAPNLRHPPGFLEQFPKLTNLNLLGNTTINDEDLRRLTQLRKLNLALNQNIIHVSHLTNLKILDLLGQLSRVPDKEIVPLTQLENLILSFNKNIIHVSHLTHLKNLGLCGNDMVPDKELVPLTQLENLDLSTNRRIIHVSHLTALKNLGLFSNNMIFQKELLPLTQLENLDLSTNRHITHVSHLTKLKSLDLCGNDIIPVEELGSLIQLENLDLSAQKTILLPHLTTLKNLFFNNNEIITNGALVPLTQLENIRYLATPKNLVLFDGPIIIIPAGLDSPQWEDVD